MEARLPPVISHGHNSHATAHLIASQISTTTPIQEFLIKWNAVNQFFLKDPPVPIDGMITVPDSPGLGLEIDKTKVESHRELNFRDFQELPTANNVRI
ncbi:MAG: hypothetical protein OXC95_09075 [Dehalococcoidia bacterium]|nr:hypothetical protein [Dehalococcoidia bacterium]